MEKAVLISIRPEWCEKIATGKKTIEVRKSRPKLETPFKCYIYCTYGRGLIERYDQCYPNMLIEQKVSKNATWGNCCNGKVIGEFVCNSIVELAPFNRALYDVETQACITREEIVSYLKGKGYGWHISNLVIYDEPKPLSYFRIPCKEYERDNPRCGGCDYYHSMGEHPAECDCDGLKPITRAPQSWCYVEPVT